MHTQVEAELPPEIRKTVFDSLVNDVIVKREAKRRKVELTADELLAEVARVIDMSGGAEGFDEWLETQRITRAELERRINLTVTWERVKASIVENIQVTDTEIRAYYDEHPEEFQGPAGARPYIEVKASLEDRLVDERKDQTFGRWIENQRKAASVEVIADEWKEAT